MDGNDFISDAVDEATADGVVEPGEIAGSDTSTPESNPESGSAAVDTTPAPAAASFAAPSAPAPNYREEFAAWQREFMAEQKRILGEYAKPQAPTSAKQPEAPAIDPDSEAFHAKYLRTPQGWQQYCRELQNDPSLYERSVVAVVNKLKAAEFAESKRLAAEFKEYRERTDKELAQMRGFRTISDHKYAESPRWKQHGKTVESLFQDGLFNPQAENAIEKAFEYAEMKAKAAGATNAQAAQAGAKAAAATAAKVAPGAAAGSAPSGKKPQAEPRDEPSLRDGKRATTAHDTVPTRGKGKDWLASIAGDAADKAFSRR